MGLKFLGLGFIYGRIGIYVWSGWAPLYGVEIDAGIRKKICGGHYMLCFLPLDRTYTITASNEGWETETKSVTLTEENRFEFIGFTLNELQLLFAPTLFCTDTRSYFFSTFSFVSETASFLTCTSFTTLNPSFI